MGWNPWGKERQYDAAKEAKKRSEDNLKRVENRWEEVHRVSGTGRVKVNYSSEIEKLIRGA